MSAAALGESDYDVGSDGFFEPEYVNIFGVPFTFLPHEGGDGAPPPPQPKTRIEPVNQKARHAISWPNIIRIDYAYKPRLTLNLDRVEPLEIDPYESITEAGLAAIIAGKPNEAVQAAIGLERIAEDTRVQSIVFKIASVIYNAEKKPDWKGGKEIFLVQAARLVELFIQSEKFCVKHEIFEQDAVKKKVLLILNMNKVIQHVWAAIRAENTKKHTLVFDREKPIRSTADMRPWHTGKPCERIEKSHISHCVYDSGWEASEAYFLEKSDLVASFVKNDHLGFSILYSHKGMIKKYFPDFLIRLASGDYMILEVKGKESEQDQTKRDYLDNWVRAVNEHGGFGKWRSDVSFEPSDIESKIAAPED